MKSTFSNAPYLDLFDLQTPIPEGFRFPSENAERAVQAYRNRNSRIVDAAMTLDEDIDQDGLFNNAADNRKKNCNTTISLIYHARRSKIMNRTLLKWALLMTEQEH